MAKNLSRKRIIMKRKIKIFLYTIAGLLLLPLLLSYGVLDPYLHKQLDKKLEDVSQGLYSASYSNFHINLYTFNIQLKNLAITPDGTKLDHIKVKALLKFYAAELNIRFFDFYSWRFKNQVNFHSLELENPVFRIVNLPFKKSTLNINDQLKKLKELFHTQKIKLTNGAILNYDFVRNKVVFSIQNFNIRAQNLSVPASMNLNDLHFENMNASSTNFITVLDSLHSLEIKKVKISQRLNIAEIQGLNYSPRINKYQLSKNYAKNVKWNHLLIPQMSFVGLNIDSLLNKNVYARKIYLTKPLFETFSDKRYPKDKLDAKYFLVTMGKAPFKFRIDTIDVYKGDIVIESLNNNSRLPSQLFFSELKGTITDIWISKNPADEKTFMKAKIKGYFQKVVPFTLNSYPAHYPYNWAHHGNASLVGFDLKYIKKYIQTNYNIRINSGKCTDLKFNFKVDKKQLAGNLSFQYQNLDFNYLKRDGNKSLLLDFFQNIGLFARANPIKREKIRTVPVLLERNSKATLIQIWKTGIEQGIVKSVIPIKKWKN